MNRESSFRWPDQTVPAFADGCTKCELTSGPQPMVWGEGFDGANVLLVLDNPGRKWLSDGTPFFCGTRKVLLSLLEDAAIQPEKCYLAPIVKCRPRQGKPQTPEAAHACLPYLKHQLERLRADLKVGVVFGGFAMRTLFGAKVPEDSLSDFRGAWQTWEGLRFMPTYHPFVAFRSPWLLKYILDDLIQVSDYLRSV